MPETRVQASRTERAKRKIERINAALEHREGDRVPVVESFWTNFVRRVCAEKDLPGFDPYRHWDLDMMLVIPNMDPHIQPIEIVEQNDEHTLLKTGFGATIEVRRDLPMPHYHDFDITSFEAMENLEFDDPRDPRRYHEAISDQLGGIGDTVNFNYPSFVERVRGLAGDFCVYGSVCEPHEMIWRIVGTENILYKMAEDPLRVARFIERLGDFLVDVIEAQIEAAGGLLSGMVIFGDVAYDRGMMFSPQFWRDVYKPQVKRMIETIHAAGLKTMYHGCGNCSVLYEDFVEIGLDAYNPLESKAGLNVVELKQQFAGRLAFQGNIDVRILASGDLAAIEREVLTKLAAARGGGYIFASDHSIPDNVSFEVYDFVIKLVREHGQYPMKSD